MKLFIFLLSLIIYSKPSLSQGSNLQYWKNDSIIEWSDFIGLQSKSQQKYHVECGIEFYFEARSDSAIWHINAYFDPNLSWASTESKNRISLSVAKCYFEITEIWARKLRKSFMELDAAEASDLRYYLKFKKLKRQLAREIRAFSREVEGGDNTDNYVRWRERIMQELKSLSAYKRTYRVK